MSEAVYCVYVMITAAEIGQQASRHHPPTSSRHCLAERLSIGAYTQCTNAPTLPPSLQKYFLSDDSKSCLNNNGPN